MVVLSSISVVSSAIPCWIKFVSTFSHTPAFAHARNRLYTLCQGPNRSGKFLQKISVFSQYTIVLRISRLLFAGQSLCGFRLSSSKSFILFHCASLNSCLIMSLFYYFGNPAHKYLAYKQTLVNNIYIFVNNNNKKDLLQKAKLRTKSQQINAFQQSYLSLY